MIKFSKAQLDMYIKICHAMKQGEPVQLSKLTSRSPANVKKDFYKIRSVVANKKLSDMSMYHYAETNALQFIASQVKFRKDWNNKVEVYLGA